MREDAVWLWLVGIVVAAAVVVGVATAGFDTVAGVVGAVTIFVMMLVALGLIYTWLDRRS